MIEKIDSINSVLLTTLSQKKLPIGLARGKMGICIYFFESGRIRNKKDHTEIAETILDEILEEISDSLPVGLEDGLAGVGMGIKYLIHNKYVDGDINEILLEIDNAIIKEVSYPDFFERTLPGELIGLLFYFSDRLPDIRDEEQLYIYKEIVIELINKTYSLAISNLTREPLSYKVDYTLPTFLYMLGKVYRLNFYNYRIRKIFDEITPRVLSTLPYVQANKLYLLWGMQSINKSMNSKEWEYHIELLKSRIDIDKILWEDMRNKNIYFEDGETSILMLLSTMENIPYNLQSFIQKFEKSDVWAILQSNSTYFFHHIGLFGGFCGIALAYLKIINK